MLLTNTQNATDINLIVSKSRSLVERLSSPVTTDSRNKAKILERVEQWCQVVAQGDFPKFEQRLAWAGLDLDTIRSLLVDSNEDVTQHLPPWATTLEQIIEKAQNLSYEQRLASQRYLDIKEPIPFEHIYLPCLQVARDGLLKRTGELKILTDSVQAALERQLLSQLRDLCTATLMAEFSAFRSSGNTTRDFILFNIINYTANGINNHQEKYYAFIGQLFDDGLVSLFKKYPVLGRLVATAIDLWVDATGEFCDRLATNWTEIEQSFSPEQPLKQVIDLKTGLSDPHNGGRSVIILTFDTGIKLVYKPKDLGIEAAFSQLLEWFNRQEQLLPLKVIQVLNCDTHGWVEYVESLPCKNEAEAQRFYQRSGMLLCLIYLIEGTDCHYDNLIANAEHPVLIDTETLFHHRHKTPEFSGTIKSQFLANEKLAESPLRTLMLPQWGLSANDDLDIDISGLGGREEEVGLAFEWKNINTDGMKIETDYKILKESNGPTLKDIVLTPDNYLTELLAGFEQMYGFLSDCQSTLLTPDSPLKIFADLKVRYLFRATRIYDSIVRSSFTPNLLKSGIDRSIGLDVLSRAYLLEEQKPAFWSILDAELQAVEQLDIPFFSTRTSQVSLELPTGVVIPKLFEEPSFERVISRLKSLSKDDLNRQLEIIRGSFCARFVQEPNFTVSENKDSNSFLAESTSLTPEQLVQEGITLAEDLQQRGIYDDKSVTWIGLGLRANCQGFQLQSLSHNLYDGSSGVALFLAALAGVTGNSDWRDLALRTLQPLRHQLRDLNPEVIKGLKRLGIGGATGLGSIVYALVQIGNLMIDADLIEDAKKVASLITTDLINRDQPNGMASLRSLNIMSGAAGAILGCLKLSEVEASGLEQAIACGEHLLEYQDSIDEDLKPGLAQGAAGIAYALLRLFEVTQDAKFLAGAKKAIAYEQNWQDLNSKEPVLYNSWANGAASIALGRLGSLSILDTEAIRQEITRNLTTTQKYCLEDVDNLAWGNLGRIETLLVASQTLNRPELLNFGLQATTHIVQQAQSRGRFNLVSGSVPVAYNPGFFQGTTGIGYQLLRLAYPHLLPSILLWE